MATQFSFGETFINSMRYREQQDEQQRQMKLKLNEEMRQFNLLQGIRVDAQKTAEANLQERIRANNIDEAHKQGMLANDTATTKYNLDKPYEIGDYATGGILGNEMKRVKDATLKDTYEQATTFLDTDGVWKTRAFNKRTNKWETIGDVKPTGLSAPNGYGYDPKNQKTILKNLDAIKVYSDNLTKYADEDEVEYETVDSKGKTVTTTIPKDQYRSEGTGMLKESMALAGIPITGELINRIKKSIVGYDKLSAQKKIEEVDAAIGFLTNQKDMDETQGELARQWIRITTR